MARPASTDSRLARLADVSTPPLAISSSPIVERRQLERRVALQRRICDEFVEMPGTSLTVAQGARLFGLAFDICQRLFVELERDGRLRLSPDSRYRVRSAA